MTLNELLSYIDFEAGIDENGMLRLIDLQDAYLGDIGECSYDPEDKKCIADIIDRTEIYWKDYEIESLIKDSKIEEHYPDAYFIDDWQLLYDKLNLLMGKEYTENTVLKYLVNPESVEFDKSYSVDKDELIGRITDIFIKQLTERDMYEKVNTGVIHKKGMIPLYFEDEESNGVFFGGNHYDRAAEQIEQTLIQWKILNRNVEYDHPDFEREELIGQFIDIFEDELKDSMLKKVNKTAVVPKYIENDKSSFFSWDSRKKISEKIEQTLKNWELLSNDGEEINVCNQLTDKKSPESEAKKSMKIRMGLKDTEVIQNYMMSKLNFMGFETEKIGHDIYINNNKSIFGKSEDEDVYIRIADYDDYNEPDYDVKSEYSERNGKNVRARNYEEVLAEIAKKMGIEVPDYDKAMAAQYKSERDLKIRHEEDIRAGKVHKILFEKAVAYARKNFPEAYERAQHFYDRAENFSGNRRRMLRKAGNKIFNEIADRIRNDEIENAGEHFISDIGRHLAENRNNPYLTAKKLMKELDENTTALVNEYFNEKGFKTLSDYKNNFDNFFSEKLGIHKKETVKERKSPSREKRSNKEKQVGR